MKHYLSPQGALYAFEEDGSQDHLIRPDFVVASPAQIQAIQNPPLSMGQVITNFENAVQAHLDSFAATWRYESILSAASYANSGIPQFKAEALALISWRDAVWSSCYATLASVQSGSTPMPSSPEAFLASLPSPPDEPSV